MNSPSPEPPVLSPPHAALEHPFTEGAGNAVAVVLDEERRHPAVHRGADVDRGWRGVLACVVQQREHDLCGVVSPPGHLDAFGHCGPNLDAQ